jgi:diphosphate-dependent phosphofructokinase
MPSKNTELLEQLLNHPKVKETTANVNDVAIERRAYQPETCGVFLKPYTVLHDNANCHFKTHPECRKRLPAIVDNKVQTLAGADALGPDALAGYTRRRNIGIVFSGGPAPGGHNVIAGLFDACKKYNPESKIYGFLLGPDGIIENEAIEITAQLVDAHRNLGGFGMIKTGRTKIDTRQKVDLSRGTCRSLELDALVIVGGDDSNTNAAFLAQEMVGDGIQVIGVPKTIDGDLQVRDDSGTVLCAISFGFHTAARAFANQVGNLCKDGGSDVKYWHVCKVMGHVASHLALEVALQTHANMTFIGEDLADYLDVERRERARANGSVDYNAYGMTLRRFSRVICDGIVRRAAVGKNYGVIVIPEGILEFINEIQVFILKFNTIIADYHQLHESDFHLDFPTLEEKLDYLRRLARRGREEGKFSIWNTRDDDLFNDIPDFFQEGLLMERDSHGNFPFSQVETEKVLIGLVKDYLNTLMEKGEYKIGIRPAYYEKTMKKEGLDPAAFGPALFSNYGNADFLIVKESIISKKTLKVELVRAGMINDSKEPPAAVEKIFKKSVPDFKPQVYFFGYDGRGNDPTRFDATYTYNLGFTVFSLIANGATGQMAAIKNLEKGFAHWEPIGIPIAPLMHLEERKGKLQLVLERSLVDLNSVSFKVTRALREKWLAAVPGPDQYRTPAPITLTDTYEEEMPLTLMLNALDETI